MKTILFLIFKILFAFAVFLILISSLYTFISYLPVLKLYLIQSINFEEILFDFIRRIIVNSIQFLKFAFLLAIIFGFSFHNSNFQQLYSIRNLLPILLVIISVTAPEMKRLNLSEKFNPKIEKFYNENILKNPIDILSTGENKFRNFIIYIEKKQGNKIINIKIVKDSELYFAENGVVSSDKKAILIRLHNAKCARGGNIRDTGNLTVPIPLESIIKAKELRSKKVEELYKNLCKRIDTNYFPTQKHSDALIYFLLAIISAPLALIISNKKWIFSVITLDFLLFFLVLSGVYYLWGQVPVLIAKQYLKEKLLFWAIIIALFILNNILFSISIGLLKLKRQASDERIT